MYLASIDENTGHVLAHYLHTGAYQTLHNNKHVSPADEANVEFRRAILVYAAAKTHGIHGLQELAQDRIEHFGAEMGIFDVVGIIKDDFSKLLGDAAWFHDYLDEKTRVMFEEDHGVFARDDFLDCVSDVGLARVLAKCVVRLYNEKIELIASVEGASDVGSSGKASVEDCLSLTSEPAQKYATSSCPTRTHADQDCVASKRPLPDSPLEQHHAGYFSVEEEPMQAAEPEPTVSNLFSAFGWGKNKTNSTRRPKDGFAEAIEEMTEEAALEAIEEVIEVIEVIDEVVEVFEEVGDACIPATSSASIRAAQAEEVNECADYNIPDSWEDSQNMIEAGSEICPARVKHLLSGDEWRACRRCRAMVHQVAIQLVRTGHTAKGGYARVDQGLTR